MSAYSSQGARFCRHKSESGEPETSLASLSNSSVTPAQRSAASSCHCPASGADLCSQPYTRSWQLSPVTALPEAGCAQAQAPDRLQELV